LFVVPDPLIEFNVETVEEVTREGTGGGGGVGFEIGGEGDFEGLK